MYICSIYIVYNLQAKYLIGIERLFINLLVIYFVDATRYIELQYLPTSSGEDPVPFFIGSSSKRPGSRLSGTDSCKPFLEDFIGCSSVFH